MRQNKPASPDPSTMSDECFADPDAATATIGDYVHSLQNTAADPDAEGAATIPDLPDILEIATIPALPMTKTVEGLRNLTATITGFTVAILAEVPAELLNKAMRPMTSADIAAEAAFMRHCHAQGLLLRAREQTRNSNN